MATTKPLPLYSAGDVARSLEYLHDPKRPSHKGYDILPDHVGGHDDFVRDLGHGIDWLNSECSVAHRVKTWGYWLFANFGPGSHLDAAERTFVANAITTGLHSTWHRAVWHVDRLRGCSDYNLILPSFSPGPMPTLRRFVVLSLWCMTKAILERAVSLLNADRLRKGRALLADVRDVQLQKAEVDGVNLAILLSNTARKSNSAIDEKTLPTLLADAGLHPGEWLIRGRQLFIKRTRKKPRGVAISVLLAAARSGNLAPSTEPARSVQEMNGDSEAPNRDWVDTAL